VAVITSVKFTQGQVRTLTGLTEPTLRVWSRHIPPLRALKGKGQNFTLGNVIALMVIDQAVRHIGCPISSMPPRVTELFQICADVSLADNRSGYIIFRGNVVLRLWDLTQLSKENGEESFVVIPLRPILSQFNNSLNPRQFELLL